MTDDSKRETTNERTNGEKIDTVLFDVDGTLIDSTYHHAIAWARAFARFDLYPPLWRVQRSIGMGGDQLVPSLVGDGVEEKHGDELRDAWEEEYEKLLPEVRGFDSAADAVRAAKKKGFKVALASSGKDEFADAALEKIGLTRDDFDAVTSSDDAENSKPEPDILEAALEAAGGTHGVLVGDATWDVEAAKKAGMKTMGLRAGGFSAAELRDAGAIDVVDAITDLRDGAWLDRLV